MVDLIRLTLTLGCLIALLERLEALVFNKDRNPSLESFGFVSFWFILELVSLFS